MKKLFSLVLTVAMVLSMACFASAEENTTLTIVAWDVGTTPYYQAQKEAFEATHPGVTIEYVDVASQDWDTKAGTMLSGGDTSDLFMVKQNINIMNWAQQGFAEPLTDYIAKDNYDLSGFVGMEPNYALDGTQYALPFRSDFWVLFYNKTLFEELNLTVPSTWEDLVETCKAVKAAKGEDVLPFGIDSPIDLAQTLFLEAGYTYIDTENKCVGFAEGEKVAAWLGEQLTAGLFSKDAPSGGYFSDDFNTGKVAMYYGSCAGVPYIKPNGFEYAVAPAPSSTSEYKSYTIWNRGPIVFKYEGQDARAEGAYEFVKYLLATPEISEGWAEAMIAMTPWVAAQQVEGYEAFVASQPALAAVQARTDIAVSLPSVTGASECRDALKNLVVALQGGTEPATALADCVAVCNAALQGK